MTRKLFALLSAVILLGSAPAWAGRLHPDVDAQLGALPPGGVLSVIVELRDQMDPATAAAQGPRGPTRAARIARRRAVRDALQDHANRHQGPVRTFLAQEQTVGSVHQTIPLWIFNGLAVRANEAVIRQLAARADVKEVRLDRLIPKPSPTPASALPAVGVSEWNIQQIRAPEVWQMAPGFDGTGSVVGSFDTGVDGTHPDLAPRYRGGTGTISWFDPYGEHATPFDHNSHGTHTTGIAVGGDAGGTHIGVAPGAKWIAAKAWNDADVAVTSVFHQIFQWFLAPGGDAANAPDVVNGSWVDDPGCIAEWRPDVQALRAAGIFPSFASGNNGPTSRSAQSPGNYPEAFAVGATDSTDTIAYFSGRGSSRCDNSIKPDVTAPGFDITSAVPGGYATESGTSMATPHVTGAVAVLRSINQALTVDQLEAVLVQGAVDRGKVGADNAYGAGRIDLFASAQLAIDPNAARVTIAATQPTAREAGLVAGVFTVTRTGSTTTDLTVHYTISGTAAPSQDYVALPGAITIPNGSASATITVVPVNDSVFELDESVVVSLSVDAAYLVMSPSQATVTIVSDDAPPVLTVSATTVPAGGQVTLTVTNGVGNADDWLTFAATGMPNTNYVQWTLVGAGVTTRTWTVTMPTTLGTYEFRYFLHNTYTRIATSQSITVSPPPPPPVPVLTVSATTVPVGGQVTLTVTNGPGNPEDWLTFAATGMPNTNYVQWTLVGAGVTTRTWTVMVPSTTGTYEFRYFINNTYTRVATSPTITVTAPPPPPPPPVTGLAISAPVVVAGGQVTLTVTNGPGNAEDWLTFAATGMPNTNYVQWTWVGAGVKTRTWTVTVPMTPGTYEFRYFINNTYTRIATSPTLTVTATPPPPPPVLTVSATTVPAGGQVTLTVTNAPGNPQDWLTFAATGMADTNYVLWTWEGGVATQTWTVTVPATPGPYEFRYFINNTYTRIATSPTVTVGP